MNLAFAGYEELSRSRRVLSAKVDNTRLDLLNSSYPTQPHSLIGKYERCVLKHETTVLSNAQYNLTFSQMCSKLIPNSARKGRNISSVDVNQFQE